MSTGGEGGDAEGVGSSSERMLCCALLGVVAEDIEDALERLGDGDTKADFPLACLSRTRFRKAIAGVGPEGRIVEKDVSDATEPIRGRLLASSS